MLIFRGIRIFKLTALPAKPANEYTAGFAFFLSTFLFGGYDSKYEWAFLYVLNDLDQDLLDVYKRIGNLYNDINAALNAYKTSPTDKEHHGRLEDAFKKFTSKLKKIKYAKFLDLQKEILLYICNNKSHYGMNIYRFERKLRLYNITSEVKRLLEAKDDAEESNIIKKSVILNVSTPD